MQGLALISVTTEILLQLNSISQFRENWILNGNTVGEFSNFEISQKR